MAINNEKFIIKNLDEIINEGYSKYAKYVIQERALPDIRDGLKPVQRRILFAMNSLKITHDRQYKKSARSVGEVIGKYHPHGDSSIYEAMVRMSQEWKNNIPLLDMHGNKGSIDGDNAAAMRYTETRLSKICTLMLNNIEKNTVDFINNFDDSEIEPVFLPALFPNLLVNGATGIAAGFATNISPMNISEVFQAIIYCIDNKNASIEKIMKIIKGPDFPTGGIVQGLSGIYDAYKTGKGKFIIRAKIIDKELKDKKYNQLVVTEIPYETNKANIIRSIDDIIINNKISGILEVRDESDRNGINIVIDIDKSKSFDIYKKFLYKATQLQITYNQNFVCIDNKSPVLMPLDIAIEKFIKHAINIIIKRNQFDLNKFFKRKEIVSGLIKAVSILDEIIELIRISTNKEDAKKNLINKFFFTDNQAEAIVLLRLYKLTSTDISDLRTELKNLNEKISQLELLLNDKQIQENELKATIRKFDEEFGYKRRTVIENEIEKIVLESSDLLENKNYYLMITRDGYIKSTTKKSIDSSIYNSYSLKTGDILINMFCSNSQDQIVLITSHGRYINIPVFKIETSKYKDLGTHLSNYVSLNENEKIIYSFNVSNLMSDDRIIIIMTKDGFIKRLKVSSLTFFTNAKSSNIVNFKNATDKIVSASIQNEEKEIIVFTKNGFYSKYLIDEIAITNKSSMGIKAIKLKDDDELRSYVTFDNQKHFLLITNQSFKKIKIEELKLTKRYNEPKNILIDIHKKKETVLNTIIYQDDFIFNILYIDNTYINSKIETIPSDLKKKAIEQVYLDEYLLNKESYPEDI